MFTVTKRLEVSASHQLKLDYPSKCQNLHGHNWIITVHTSSHSCMSARGIKSTDSQTTTLATKGVFNEDNMIHRFMLMKQS